jgi:hypothetical protein
MKTFYIIFILLSVSLFYSCEGKHVFRGNDSYVRYFAQLDSAFLNKSSYVNAFNARLSSLKQKSLQSQNIEEQYFYNKLIYESYIPFISDSAFVYLNRNYQIASRYNEPYRMAETYIAMANAYSTKGLLAEAEDALDEAARFPMSKEIKIEYCVQQIFYLTHKANFLRTPTPPEVRNYCDSIIMLENDKSQSCYLWARFWKEEAEGSGELRTLIERKINSIDSEDPWYSRLCFAEGVLYALINDRENQVRYLVRSLIVDISHVSRDLPMLPVVASIACEVGELGYANRFIKATVNIQNDFPDLARASYLNQYINDIHNATIRKLEEDADTRRHLVRILFFAVLILVCLLAFVYSSLRKQYRLSRQLSESNQRLDRHTKELAAMQAEMERINVVLREKSKLLEETNNHLIEANYLKEEYIGNLFTVCADYLNKIRNLRKTINLKLKVKQYEELRRMTKPSDTHAADEVRELYQKFDTVFLSIFPDFVKEFNTLLRPEERIAWRSDELLTTDLRIYALVRLGINNSVRISNILHISPQTVYNVRLRMRSKAALSDEKFSQQVKRLGGTLHTSESPQED